MGIYFIARKCLEIQMHFQSHANVHRTHTNTRKRTHALDGRHDRYTNITLTQILLSFFLIDIYLYRRICPDAQTHTLTHSHASSIPLFLSLSHSYTHTRACIINTDTHVHASHTQTHTRTHQEYKPTQTYQYKKPPFL